MNNLSGGYIMVDLASPNKVKQLKKAAALNKPLLVYYADGTTEWGKVSVTYETVDDVDIPTYHIITANSFVTVEADGDVSTRPKFIEGEGETSITAFTNLYKKWSLSGTHLMCVFAGKNGSGSSYQVDSGTTICDFSVPEWILNKIHPISGNIIELKNMGIYISGNFNSNFATKFIKDTNKISIIANENKQFGNKTEFKIQYDLLIDNE